jgi:hypothetical protein
MKKLGKLAAGEFAEILTPNVQLKPRHDSRLKQLPLGSAPFADQYNKVTFG